LSFNCLHKEMKRSRRSRPPFHSLTILRPRSSRNSAHHNSTALPRAFRIAANPMTWSQEYNPLPHWLLSTLVSALPVLTLFFILLVLKKRVWAAALGGLIMAVLLASFVFHMPAGLISRATLLGVVFGFLRIAWILIASIFLYHIAVETGQFQIMKESIAA